MWGAIRELMNQFDEAIIVLDEHGEMAVINPAAQARLVQAGTVDRAEGIRVLRLPGGSKVQAVEESMGLPIPQLDQASSGLPVVLAIRSLEQYVYVSPAYERIFGEGPEALFTHASAAMERVHEEDLARVKESFEADRAGSPQDYEYRFRHADGAWRKLRVKVHPFLDRTTGQQLIASLAEDITDSKPVLRKRNGSGVSLQSANEFRKALEQCVDNWNSAPQAAFFALAFVDLVRFRAVNDSFGFAEGDRVLGEVGRRIQACVPSKNVVAGFGSDRFAILFRSSSEGGEVEALMQKLLREVAAPMMLGETTIQVSARAGAAFPQGMDCSADALLRNADAALQMAKQRREPIIVSTISRSAKSMEQASLEFDLSRAIDNEEFFFEFQPVFDPVDGKIQLLEALVRWRHPRLGVISPSSFISLAEDSGLVLRLDMQGLERLGRQLEYWHEVEPQMREIPVSINISGRHFPNFVMEKQFLRLLKEPALRQATIIFEITESVFVESNHRTAAGLERLRQAGVKIWLDDFGDGYSSFRYLAHFPVDGIKISESFVKKCVKEEKSRVILASLQTLARGLNVDVVVEGVESREQFETVKTMGFTAVQGYYLSRPIAAKDVPKLFAAATMAKAAGKQRA